MEWLQITGSLIAFIGSVMISAELLQTRKHAEAQSGTYLNRNPFTLQSTQRNLFAFMLIVLGFAIDLSVDVSNAAYIAGFKPILILIGFVCLGALAMILIHRANKRSYNRIEAERRLTVFNSAVSNMEKRFSAIIGQYNEKDLFVAYKETSLAKLKEYHDQLQEAHKNESTDELMQKLSSTRSSKGIVKAAQAYTQAISLHG